MRGHVPEEDTWVAERHPQRRSAPLADGEVESGGSETPGASLWVAVAVSRLCLGRPHVGDSPAPTTEWTNGHMVLSPRSTVKAKGPVRATRRGNLKVTVLREERGAGRGA